MKNSHCLYIVMVLGVYESLCGKAPIAHRSPHYTQAFLQSTLDAFTQELLQEPENYQKIAALFKVISDNLDNNPHDYLFIKKSLEQLFLIKNKKDSQSLDYHAINLALQKLWLDKELNLTPHAKDILKRYKNYNAAYYKRILLHFDVQRRNASTADGSAGKL